MHMSKRKGEIVTTLAVQQAQAIDSPHVNKKRRGGKAKKTRNKKQETLLFPSSQPNKKRKRRERPHPGSRKDGGFWKRKMPATEPSAGRVPNG
jgi:hypothetical protein